MKIISKFKDYYDHEVAYFGFDDSRIYDRRALPIYTKTMFNCHLFAICGEIVPVVYKHGRFFFNQHKSLDIYDNQIFIFKGKKTNINEIERQPVLAVSYSYKKLVSHGLPILKNFGIPNLFNSREMYSKIYDFLGWLKDNPVPPNNQTNKEKIVAHGFDVKKSFRPLMK
jgi:hypothetical protein